MSECKHWVIMFNDYPKAIVWDTEEQARGECERIRDQYIKENFIENPSDMMLFVRPVEIPVVDVASSGRIPDPFGGK